MGITLGCYFLVYSHQNYRPTMLFVIFPSSNFSVISFFTIVLGPRWLSVQWGCCQWNNRNSQRVPCQIITDCFD